MQKTLDYIITTQPGVADTAMGELRHDGDVRTKIIFSPEARLIEAPKPLPKDLIFVRHMFPVTYSGDIAAAKWQRILPGPDSVYGGMPFSVQLRLANRDESIFARGREIISEGESILTQRGFPKNDKAPLWALSFFIHGMTLYAGVSFCADNLSKWNGGEMRFKKDEGFISRAEFKLLEAFEVFGLDMLGNAEASGPDAASALTALDLGAAPGGWSRALLDKGFRVTAVDPAQMHESLTKHPGLTHLRATAQRCAFKDASFDLIVNDMRMDMYASARVMLEVAHALKPRGKAVMTLKLTPGHWLSKTANVFKLLEEKYTVSGARQLFHNRDEVTVCLNGKNL
jgi:23S rRNA (cytidine2498-2'-O)-methyltransferase